MITSPFNTSASNFGNAEIQAAGRWIPLDVPVEMRPAYSWAGEEVHTSKRAIPIDPARLAECRDLSSGWVVWDRTST